MKQETSAALVSVILPCYNKEKYITQTIRSVINQTYTDWELLIVDDCSTDNSLSIVCQFSGEDKRIKVIKCTENRGANHCRNEGIRSSGGDYLIFLDADDLLAPFCISSRVKFMTEHPELEYSVHTLQVFVANPGDDSRVWKPKVKDPLSDFLSHKLPWQTMQPIWRKSCVLAANGFDESFTRLQDVEFHTRMLLNKSYQYTLIDGTADCFLRVDEARKNFATQVFLSRWIASASMFCDKFQNKVSPIYRSKLTGTILRAQEQIGFRYKNSELTDAEVNILIQQLRSSEYFKNLSILKKLLLKFSFYYNTNFPRIPGINRIIGILAGL